MTGEDHAAVAGGFILTGIAVIVLALFILLGWVWGLFSLGVALFFIGFIYHI